jgi:hypothetical protein
MASATPVPPAAASPFASPAYEPMSIGSAPTGGTRQHADESEDVQDLQDGENPDRVRSARPQPS